MLLSKALVLALGPWPRQHTTPPHTHPPPTLAQPHITHDMPISKLPPQLPWRAARRLGSAPIRGAA